jgi:Lipase (class 3)
MGYDRKSLSLDNSNSFCNGTVPLWPNNADNSSASSSSSAADGAFVLGCTAPLFPGVPISNGSVWTGLIGGLSRYDGSLSLSVSFPGDSGIQSIVNTITYDVDLEGLGNAAAATSTKAPPPEDWVPVAALANATMTMRCNTDYPTLAAADDAHAPLSIAAMPPISCAPVQLYDSSWTSFGQGGGGGYGLYRFTVTFQDDALSNYATNSTLTVSFQVAAFRASEIALRICLMVITLIAGFVWLRNMLWRRTRNVAIDKTTGSPIILISRVWTPPWKWLPQQKWVAFLFFVLLLWLNPLYVASQLMLPTYSSTSSSSSSPPENSGGNNNDLLGGALLGPHKRAIPTSSASGGAGVPWQLFLSAAILEVAGWAAIFTFFWTLVDGMKVAKADIIALAGRHAFEGLALTNGGGGSSSSGSSSNEAPSSALSKAGRQAGGGGAGSSGSRATRTATLGGRASFISKSGGGGNTLQVGSSVASLPPSTLARKATAVGSHSLATSAASSMPPQMSHLGYGIPGKAVALQQQQQQSGSSTSHDEAFALSSSSVSASSSSGGSGSTPTHAGAASSSAPGATTTTTATTTTGSTGDALVMPDENESVHKRAAAAMLLALLGDDATAAAGGEGAGPSSDTTGAAGGRFVDPAWSIPGLSHGIPTAATTSDYRARLGSAENTSTTIGGGSSSSSGSVTGSSATANSTSNNNRPLLPPVVRLGEYVLPSHFLMNAFGFFLDANDDDDDEVDKEGKAEDDGSGAIGTTRSRTPSTAAAAMSINVVVSDNGFKASPVLAPVNTVAPSSLTQANNGGNGGTSSSPSFGSRGGGDGSLAASGGRKRSSAVAPVNGNNNGGSARNGGVRATQQGWCSWLCCGCYCCRRSACCQAVRSLFCGEVVVHSKASPLYGVRAYPTSDEGWAFYWPKVMFFIILTFVGSALEALSQPDQLFGGRTSSTNPLSSPQGARRLFTAVIILGGIYLVFMWGWFLLFLWSSVTTGRQLEKLPYVATRYQQLSYRFFVFQQMLVVLYILACNLYPIIVFLVDIRAHPLVSGGTVDSSSISSYEVDEAMYHSQQLSRLQELKRQSLLFPMASLGGAVGDSDSGNTSGGGIAISVETQVASIIRSVTEAVTPIGELIILSVSVWILAYFYSPPKHALPPGLVGNSVEGAEATSSELSVANSGSISTLGFLRGDRSGGFDSTGRPLSGAISRSKNVTFVDDIVITAENTAESSGANAATTSLAIRHGNYTPMSSSALSSPTPGGRDGGFMELPDATPRSAISSYSGSRGGFGGGTMTGASSRPAHHHLTQSSRQSVSLRSVANAVVSAPVQGINIASKAANALRSVIEETLLGLPPDAAEHRFSTATASVLFDFSSAVYFDPPDGPLCGLSERTPSSYGVLPAAPHGFSFEGVAYSKETDTMGIVWRQGHRIVIAFRGTVTKENVATDLKFRPEAVEFGVDTDILGQAIAGSAVHQKPGGAAAVATTAAAASRTASAPVSKSVAATAAAPKTPDTKPKYASRALRAQIAASRQPQEATAPSSIAAAGKDSSEAASAYGPLDPSAVAGEAAMSHKTSSAASHVPVVRLALPMVHQGFWRAYSSVRPQLKAIVRNALVSAFSETGTATAYCTGHSLGGSLASLCAYDIHPLVNEVRKSLVALDPSIAMAISRMASSNNYNYNAAATTTTTMPVGPRSWGAGHPLPSAAAGASGAASSRPPVFSTSAIPTARGTFSPGPSVGAASGAAAAAAARRPSASMNSTSALGPYARYLLSQQQEQLERQQSSSSLSLSASTTPALPSAISSPTLLQRSSSSSSSSTSIYLDPAAAAAAAAATAFQLERKQEDDEDDAEEDAVALRAKRGGAPLSASKLNRGGTAAAPGQGVKGGYGATTTASADRLDQPLLADGDDGGSGFSKTSKQRSRTGGTGGPLGALAAAKIASNLLGKRKRTGSGAALKASTAGGGGNGDVTPPDGDADQEEDDEDRLAIEILLDDDVLEGEDPLDCVGIPPSEDPSFDSELFIGNEDGARVDTHRDVVCYTFGAPRVGNAQFARLYNSRCPWTFRVVFDGDFITSLPPKIVASGCRLAFYKHLGNEAWVDGAGNCIIDPSALERSFRVKAKTSFRAHRMASYRRALVNARRNEGLQQFREFALSKLLPPSTWGALLALSKALRDGGDGGAAIEDGEVHEEDDGRGNNSSSNASGMRLKR